MAMTTDCEPSISAKACQWVSDLDSRYGGFTQNQLLAGLKYSYDFQCLLSPVSAPRSCEECYVSHARAHVCMYVYVRVHTAFLFVWLVCRALCGGALRT